MKPNILIIDNYDSFTYNLYNMVKELGYSRIKVLRNDCPEVADMETIDSFDKIILSPGPGIPSDAGFLKDIIMNYAPVKSMLGVCLGHQAIAEVFGAKLYNMASVYHGVSTAVNVTNPHILFEGMGNVFNAGRYHSWVVSPEGIPSVLEVTAQDDNGFIMALRHRNYDVHGVQFHPESVLTPEGRFILNNWLNN